MAKLTKDHRGNPVQTENLTEPIATQTVTGVRSVWHESVSSQLTPETLAEVLLGIDQNNDILAYLTLAEEMEERDLHYRSVLSTRKLAVAKLEVSVESVADDAKSEKEADFVREIFSDVDNIRPLFNGQLDALGKGYSVNEIMWDRSGALWVPEKYIWRDQHFFQFDSVTHDEIRLRDEADLIDGLPLEPYKFIVHTPALKSGLKIRSGLARLAAVAYMCKGYSIKDWMAFAEVYGMPLRIGKYNSGASAEDKGKLLRAVANIGTDAAAIIPESMIIDFVDGARSGGGIGEAVFERLANWLDRQVSKGVLGQTMTTDDGSSQSQATVHDEVRGDIMENDAQQLSATLRRDLVKPIIDLNFGTRKRNEYPKVRLIIEEPEDLESLSKSLPKFIDRGLKVDASVILGKFGLSEPAEGAELLLSEVEMEARSAAATSESGTPESTKAEARNKDMGIKIALMQQVLEGKTLTEDQKELLALLQQQDTDSIDDLVAGEMKDWQQVMDPMLSPIIELAQNSKDEKEFIAGLDSLSKNMDVDPLVKSLATATLKSRGLGDATDKV